MSANESLPNQIIHDPNLREIEDFNFLESIDAGFRQLSEVSSKLSYNPATYLYKKMDILKFCQIPRTKETDSEVKFIPSYNPLEKCIISFGDNFIYLTDSQKAYALAKATYKAAYFIAVHRSSSVEEIHGHTVQMTQEEIMLLKNNAERYEAWVLAMLKSQVATKPIPERPLGTGALLISEDSSRYSETHKQVLTGPNPIHQD